MLPAGLWLLDFFISQPFLCVLHTVLHEESKAPLAHYSYAPVGKFMNSPAHLRPRQTSMKKKHKTLQTHTPDIHVQTLGKCVCMFIGEQSISTGLVKQLVIYARG